MNKVFFHNVEVKAGIRTASQVKSLIESIFIAEKKILERVDYIFCNDDYLLVINKQFLNHNTLTDTITFTLSESYKPIIGEIYISVDRIKENAKTYSVTYQKELLRVMIHSALHLCGYNDNSKEKKQKMHLRENFFLDK